MKRRLISLFLSLTLLLSLSAPGAAADEERFASWYETEYDALLDQLLAERPGLLDGFNPDAWFELWYEGYYSKEEYMSYWELTTQEAFYDDMLESYLQHIVLTYKIELRIEQYEAAHPGALDDFDPYAWFDRTYSDYMSREDYLNNGLSEEEFRLWMLDSYLDSLEVQQQQQDVILAYEAEHPGTLASFNPDEYLRQLGYTSPREAYMSEYGIETEAELEEYLRYMYIAGLNTAEEARLRLAEFEAEHPGAAEQFDPDAYFDENYTWVSGGVEEFMREYGIATREVLDAYLLLEWLADQQEQEEMVAGLEAYKRATIEQLGGTPGEINIMLNNSFLKFPSQSQPYMKNGVVYAPAEAISQALGVKAPVRADGYTPVQPLATQKGYEVLWDDYYQSLVLLDTHALAETLDQDFTLINQVLSSLPLPTGGNRRSEFQVDANCTAYNSLDGDSSYTLDLAGWAIESGDGLELSLHYDLKSLFELMAALEPEVYSYFDLPEVTQMRGLFEGNFDLRTDWETVYVRYGPILNYIASSSMQEDTWLAVPITDLPVASTIGSYLCASAVSDFGPVYRYLDPDPIYRYNAIVSLGKSLSQIIGDSQFERAGSAYELTLDEGSSFLALLQTLSPYYHDVSDTPQVFKLTLSVQDGGQTGGSLTFRPSSFRYGPDYLVTADWSLSPQSQTIKIDYHIKNYLKVSIKLTGTQSDTSLQPETAPPQGAAVIPAEEAGW